MNNNTTNATTAEPDFVGFTECGMRVEVRFKDKPAAPQPLAGERLTADIKSYGTQLPLEDWLRLHMLDTPVVASEAPAIYAPSAEPILVVDSLDGEEPMEPLDVSLRGLLEKAAAIVKDAHKDGGRPVRACMFPPQQAMSKAERKAKKAARKAKPIRDWIVPAQRLVLIPRQGDAAGWLIDFVEYEPLSRDAHEFAVKKGHSKQEAEAFARFVDMHFDDAAVGVCDD